MDNTILPWVVVLLPLLGFLIIAFIGAGLTKEPAPVVEPPPVEGASPYAMESEDDEDTELLGPDGQPLHPKAADGHHDPN